MAQLREDVVEEVRKLGVDVLFSEKGHFMAARMWRVVNYSINIPSATLAAIAGVAFFKGEYREYAGWFAVAASALTAVGTALNAADRSARHHRAGVLYAALRREIRNFVQVEAWADTDDAGLVSTLQSLTRSVSKLQGDSPAIFGLAYDRAKRSLKAGSANYSTDELNAATGELPRSGQSADRSFPVVLDLCPRI